MRQLDGAVQVRPVNCSPQLGQTQPCPHCGRMHLRRVLLSTRPWTTPGCGLRYG
jgi:hypothetical protein